MSTTWLRLVLPNFCMYTLFLHDHPARDSTATDCLHLDLAVRLLLLSFWTNNSTERIS